MRWNKPKRFAGSAGLTPQASTEQMEANPDAVGIIAVSVPETLRADLMGYLFGYNLASGPLDP